MYKRQAKINLFGRYRNFQTHGGGDVRLGQSGRDGPVSYTHLDVYKRQVIQKARAWGVYFGDCACPNFSPYDYVFFSVLDVGNASPDLV